jgi:two-component system chemotaxis response regulator CheB
MVDPSPPSPSRRLRVLVVDDSALVRQAIKRALEADPEIEVVGSACDAYVAREKIERLAPDVITLDLEMPRMHGLEFLRILMKHHPLPVVVVSSLTQAGSQAAMDALEAGAVDVLAKPDGTMSLGAVAERIAFHVKAAGRSARIPSRTNPVTPPTPVVLPRSVGGLGPKQLVVIGASTGGIEALRTLLPQFPADGPPVAVVQHISAHFSRIVAGRLDEISGLRVREAVDGDRLEPGGCVLAPGDQHMIVEFDGSGFRTRLLRTPPVHHCRPAVDVLFRSAAEAAGPDVVAALLTGMGCDGALGMLAVREAGGSTIAQDEATSVVYGMPRAAVERGAVDRVVPLPEVARAILQAVERRRLPTGRGSR